MIKRTPTRELGQSKKTRSLLITFELTVKAVGVPSPRLLVCLSFSLKTSLMFLLLLLNHMFLTDRAVSYGLGLHRCGKSCRLRWINYLRPDIKRGNFAQDEEDLIIKLHALLGNRYSLSLSVRNYFLGVGVGVGLCHKPF